MRVRVGIFVGGRATRMGGVAKGLLRTASGTSLLDRLLVECRAALADSALVLVGNATAYAGSQLPALSDTPPGIGPLGGLRALLLNARECGDEAVLAIATDMPRLSRGLLARLANEQPAALALAPRDGAIWHPLTARYALGASEAVEQALAAGEHSLQRIFARLGAAAVALPVDSAEHAELCDWDEPTDIERA